MRIRNWITITLMLSFMVLSSGCASYLSYEASKKEILTRRAYASGNPEAIKAVRSGDFVGIGIDVLAWETLTENPWRQLGAAGIDALTLWAAYEGIDYLNNDGDDGGGSSGSSGGSGNTSGNDTIVVNGDGNIVNTSGSEEAPEYIVE